MYEMFHQLFEYFIHRKIYSKDFDLSVISSSFYLVEVVANSHENLI